MANNKFEETMMAVQKAKMESRKSKTSKKAKKVVESKSVKRRKKIQNESLAVTEDEEIDEIDIDDEGSAEDISDEIVAVVDPDMDVDEYEDRIDELEDIIDETPEGEVPLDDEYIGDEIYECPVCGNAFFSDVDLHDGGTCPVCGEDVEDFVEVGKVESTDADGDGEVDPDEDLDPENDVEDEEIVEEEEELDVNLDDIEEEVCPDCGKKHGKGECNYSRYDLDENTLNPFLTKFIKENYKNAVSMKAVKASVRGKRLKIECAIKMKSGKNKMTTVVIENFQPIINKSFKLEGYAGKEFKVESSNKKKPSFVIGAKLEGKTVKIESFKYNFVTVKEGKRCQVAGNYALKESAKKMKPLRTTTRKRTK